MGAHGPQGAVLSDEVCLQCKLAPSQEGSRYCSETCAEIAADIPEWDSALAGMQTPEFAEAAKAAFNATPVQLGTAAVKHALDPDRARPKVVRLVVVQDSEEVDTSIVDEHQFPATRGECKGGARPCPWVRCEHHVYLDVLEDGSIRMNFPGKEVWELEETCSLDVADREGATLEEVGRAVNLTRERVRQLIEQALKNAHKNTNPMYKSSLDVENHGYLERPEHPLGD